MLPVKKGLVVLPCFNEAIGISALLSECSTFCRIKNFEIDFIVVNDGSRDDTAKIARNHVYVLDLPFNLGIGGCVQTGIQYARSQNYDFCVQLDGDGQHPPEELLNLLKEWETTGADLVTGSRFLETESFRSSWIRRVGIIWIRSVMSLLTGYSVSDPTSGFRLMSRKCIQLFAKSYPRDFPEPVAFVMAVTAGLKTSEVAVKMRPRIHGQSSLSGMKTLSYMVRVTFNLMFARFQGFLQ